MTNPKPTDYATPDEIENCEIDHETPAGIPDRLLKIFCKHVENCRVEKRRRWAAEDKQPSRGLAYNQRELRRRRRLVAIEEKRLQKREQNRKVCETK